VIKRFGHGTELFDVMCVNGLHTG